MPLDPIVAQTHVPVPPTPAFTGFTAQMGEWWDPLLTPEPATFTGIEIDPEGEVAMVHGQRRHVWGRVTTWAPDHEFALDFWLDHDPEQPTTLRVTFTPDDDGTEVRLEHGGWDDAATRASYTRWPELLERYAAHVG